MSYNISFLQRDKREKEFKQWLQFFIENQKKYFDIDVELIQDIDTTAKILNIWYWRRIETHIVPAMTFSESESIETSIDGDDYLENKDSKRKYINHSKIASGIELSIISVKPIKFVKPVGREVLFDNSKRAEWNAKLAWYITLSFLRDWKEITDKNIYQEMFAIKPFNDFRKEHIRWLQMLAPDYEYPIFSNAQTIRLFSILMDIFIKDKYSVVKVYKS